MIVYCHTNLCNGKRYIGWTSYTIEERWEWHCREASRGSAYIFHAAIRKYGTECWQHEVLETHETQEDARTAEIRLIAENQTFYKDHPKLGYNMTLGGEGLAGYSHRQETKQKISESLKGNSCGKGNKGRVVSADVRQKIRESLTGRKRPQYEKDKISTSLKGNTRGRGNRGRPLSEEHKEKLRQSALTRAARKREIHEDSL